MTGLVEDITSVLMETAHMWATLLTITTPQFIVIGSACLPELADTDIPSDVDIVCVADVATPEDKFFLDNEESFVRMLFSNPNVSHIRVVTGATVPIIKCVILETDVDILYMQLVVSRFGMACTPSTFDPLANDAFDYVKPSHQKQLKSMRMYMIVYNERPPLPAGAHLSQLVRMLRKWAKSRCLYGTKYGFGGGATYTLIAIAVLWNISVSHDDVFEIVAQKCFRFLSLHPWPAPLCIPRTRRRCSSRHVAAHQESVGPATHEFDFPATHGDTPSWYNNACAALANGMVVLTPVDSTGTFNSTHNSSVFTADIFRAECMRALVACDNEDFFEALCRPYSVIEERLSDFFFIICLDNPSGQLPVHVMQEYVELTESRLLAVMSQLQATGFCCRFWPKFLCADDTHRGIFVATVHPLTPNSLDHRTMLDASPVQDVLLHAVFSAIDRMPKNCALSQKKSSLVAPILAFAHIAQLPAWVKMQLKFHEIPFLAACP